MQLVAKFQCQEVDTTADGEKVSLVPAQAVDNEAWAGNAAVGNFVINIGPKSEFAGQFKPGQTYAVTIEG